MATQIDWCEICEEVSTHAKICEVCGEDLVERPAGSGSGSATTAAAAAAAASGSAAAAAGASMSHEEAATILSAVEAHRIGSAAAAATASSDEGPSITSVAQSWATQDQQLLLEAVRTATGNIATGDAGDRGEWQAPPPEAMNPSAASGKDRPTSRECIERIPRIAVGPHSSILHECCITVQPPVMCGPFGGCGGSAGNPIKRKVHTYDSAVVAEFGPAPPYTQNGRLVLCHPATGKGGLEPTTMASLSSNSNYPTIAYMERGDGVTFVRKALMAQAAGASAVVIGNNCGVWPYVMQDSADEANKGVKMGNLKGDVDDDDGGDDGPGGADKNEKSDAKKGDKEEKSSSEAKDGDDKSAKEDKTMKKEEDSTTLTIPVVMVKRSDGKYIRKLLEESPGCTTRCTIAAKVLGEKGGCIICTDKFDVGDTVMRLPFCSHCFHEKCALTWLKKHNTCPMCRRELPTDDQEYESRRRAEGRSHAAAASDDSAGGLDVSQWESLFG